MFSAQLYFSSLSVRHFYWVIHRAFMEVIGCLSPHHRFRSLLSVTSTIQRAFMEVSSCLVLFLTFASVVCLSVSYWAVPRCAVELEVVLTVICVTGVHWSWQEC